MPHIKISENQIGVSHVFLFYWITLVVWQNMSSVTLRSGFDLVLKIGLIFILSAFYLLNAKSISKNIIVIMLLALSMLITFWTSGDAISGSNLIGYFYPVLLSVLSFGIGNSFQIRKQEFLFFLNGIIFVTLCAALFALFVQTDRFVYAFSNRMVYGRELTSFFTSNHEYGMYLVYAIVSCVINIECKRDLPGKRRTFYIVAILIFSCNLFLTFSRTSLLAMAVIVFVYCFINAHVKLRKWMIAAVVLGVVAVITVPQLRDFVVLAMFKGDDGLGARSGMYRFAIELFADGTIIQKVFGFGLQVRGIFEEYVSHGSVHNAYLQVLMYYGIFGLIFFMALLVSQLRENIKLYKTTKFYSVTFCILLLAAMAMMFTNTAVVFTSPIDSFFLTVVAILAPKYVRNSISAGTFY